MTGVDIGTQDTKARVGDTHGAWRVSRETAEGGWVTLVDLYPALKDAMHRLRAE